MIDYAVLRTEIELPAYATPYTNGSDGTIADMLNALIVPEQLGWRHDLTAQEVFWAINDAEYLALPQEKRDLLALRFQLSTSRIDATKQAVRDTFATIFSAQGSPTLTALTALSQKPYSRAEVLFGAGTVIQHQDVAKARVA